MDGWKRVFTFAGIMGRYAECADNVGVTMDDILYGSHQANVEFFEIRPKAKYLHGQNTVTLRIQAIFQSASIPVCIDEMHSKGLIKEIRLLLVWWRLTYGLKLAWSRMII